MQSGDDRRQQRVKQDQNGDSHEIAAAPPHQHIQQHYEAHIAGDEAERGAGGSLFRAEALQPEMHQHRNGQKHGSDIRHHPSLQMRQHRTEVEFSEFGPQPAQLHPVFRLQDRHRISKTGGGRRGIDETARHLVERPARPESGRIDGGEYQEADPDRRPIAEFQLETHLAIAAHKNPGGENGQRRQKERWRRNALTPPHQRVGARIEDNRRPVGIGDFHHCDSGSNADELIKKHFELSAPLTAAGGDQAGE